MMWSLAAYLRPTHCPQARSLLVPASFISSYHPSLPPP